MSPQMQPFEEQAGTVRLDARVPRHIKESLALAAALEGRSQTDFLIGAVADAARRVIAEHSVIRICLEDQKTLAAALLGEDREPCERLHRAVRDHAATVAAHE